jgi:hypothetical protein
MPRPPVSGAGGGGDDVGGAGGGGGGEVIGMSKCVGCGSRGGWSSCCCCLLGLLHGDGMVKMSTLPAEASAGALWCELEGK